LHKILRLLHVTPLEEQCGGCRLTAVRPDYVALSKMLRQILNREIPSVPGSVLTSPMQWIRRDSA